jgi:uncharacterized RDD family membrane protein YckC
MSSMPDKDAPGQRGGTQQGARPDETEIPQQGVTPGQERQVGPESIPNQQQVPGAGTAAYGQGQGQPQQQWSGEPMMPEAGVPERATRVTGRRVFQYIFDTIVAGIIPGLAYWLLDRGNGVLHGLGWLVATVIAIAVYYWYWVMRPYSNNGKTFGMSIWHLRIISKEGGRATVAQLFIRAIFLIIDTLLAGLVGLITILFSRYRQRIGDHAARTLVIRD